MSEIGNEHFDFFEMRPQLRNYLAHDIAENGGTGIGRNILSAHLFELNHRSLHPSAEVSEGARRIDANLHTLITGARLLDDLFTYEDTRDMQWIKLHEAMKTKLVAVEHREEHAHMKRIGHRKKVTGAQLIALHNQMKDAKTNIEHCLDIVEYAALREEYPLYDLKQNIARYTHNPRIRADQDRFEWQHQSPGYISVRLEGAIQHCVSIVGALNSEEKHIEEREEKLHKKGFDDHDPNFPRSEVIDCCLCDIIPAMRILTGDMMHELENLRDHVRDNPEGTRRTRLQVEKPDNRASNVIDLSERLSQRNR